MHLQPSPPEINSVKMYTGPGPGSMRAAAATWKDVLYEMHYILRSFGTMLDWMQGQWLGPSVTRMAEAARPFQNWLLTLIEQIYQTSEEAFRILAAYHRACEMTIQPRVIADNRAQMRELLGDNVFGQYAETITDLEKQYLQYWAQDDAAMETYATNALDALSKLTPWAQPPLIVNEAGLVREAAAV